MVVRIAMCINIICIDVMFGDTVVLFVVMRHTHPPIPSTPQRFQKIYIPANLPRPPPFHPIPLKGTR